MNQPTTVPTADSLPGRMVVPLWVGEGDSALCAWLHRSVGASRGAVLVCPPLGYELWTSYQSLRVLAEQLAVQGFEVLRFDYCGTGDSGGEALAPGRLEQWRADVRAAAGELRRITDAKTLILLGLRFGGALVCEQACALGAQAVVLWDPVVSGRRYVRELKMLATKEETGVEPDEVLEVAGCLYSSATLQSLSSVDLLKLPPEDWTGMAALLLDRDDRPANTALQESLRAKGAMVTRQAPAGMSSMMDVSTEDAQVPTGIVQTIVSWLQARYQAQPTGQAAAATAPAQMHRRMLNSGATLCEEMIEVGNLPLFGILGTPTQGPAAKLVIFLSSGTEHRIGPGRAWVSLARLLNTLGVATLRVDLNGIGDSPIRGERGRVRPYDPSFFDDVSEFVSFARQRGHTQISVLGLCSGAWMAVQAGVNLDISAVVAINPQLYWQQGDPVESLIQDTRVRRRDEVRREQWGHRYGWWSLQDVLGRRTAAGKWLEALHARKVRTLLAFSDNDDGLQHLRIRCGRCFKRVLAGGVVSMVEVSGLDHPMHRHRVRPQMFAAITDFILSR